MSEEQNGSLWGRWLVIALVFGVATWAFLSRRSDQKPWGVALGQDLKGGTTLRFALDVDQARRENRLPAGETDAEIVAQTLRVVESRVNKFGVSELNVQQVGEGKFEISLPAEMDAKSVTDLVSQLGELQFRVLVRPSYADYEDPEGKRIRGVKTPAVWLGSGAHANTPEGFEAFKKAETERYETARRQGVGYVPSDPRYKLVPYERPVGAPDTVPTTYELVEEPSDATMRFGGEIVGNPRPSIGAEGHVVLFTVKTEFQNVFGTWTSENVRLPMAIILNEQITTAPQINEKLETDVQITLGRGSLLDDDANRDQEEKAKQLATVLQTGSLKVKPRLESTSTVGPTLAGQAVRRGLLSTAIAFLLVLVYMTIYYYGAGLIANLALLLNLVLIVGSMAFLDGALTLPGIAGVVLTLGMAVDANILVFERIREEQARGKSVRLAVSQGFDRAFTTIVDSNLTTFITALALLWLGSGAIKGFAVTLILGLAASMFTAVFVTRTLMETWLASGKTTPVRMLGTGRAPSVGWVRLRRYFVPISLVAMTVGVALFVVSPRRVVYDIDFTGGMKLQTRFVGPTSVDDVKKALDSGVREVDIENDVATGRGVGRRKVKAGPYDNAEVVTVGAGVGANQVEIRAPLLAGSDDATSLSEREQLDALRGYVLAAMADRVVPSWVRSSPVVYRKKDDADPRAEYDGRLALSIAVEDPADVLTAEKLSAAINDRMPFVRYEVEGRTRESMPASTINRKVTVAPTAPVEGAPPAAKGSVKSFDLWWKADGVDGKPVEDSGERLLADLRAFLTTGVKDVLKDGGASPASLESFGPADTFPTSDLVGAGVAERLRDDAILALLLSFAGIVAYVAFRFRSYAMGFASVLCLVHDVVITLGVLCVANFAGFADARINLAIVAAFLTIVGYSVNDTVVTFDRIRELRGKAPTITAKMIDDAVNQTFSRTLRTAATVLLTVAVLFVMNLGQRSVLEGLAFTLLVGVATGCYSTVGIAAPLLLFLPWYWAKVRAFRPRAWALLWPAKRTAGLALAAAALAVAIAVFVAGHGAGKAVFFGFVALPLAATVGFAALWAVAFGIGCLLASPFHAIPWAFLNDPEKAAEGARRESAATA